jgi:imidazolonepropionase-like amidohydrolase
MRIKMRLFISIITLLCVGSFLSAAQVKVIKAGKVIDPETEAVQENVLILIKGDKIKEIGKELEIPDDAEIIDLSKCTILPGLFDCHTHLCMMIPLKDTGGYGFLAYYLVQTTSDRALQGVENARTFLESGFTTVRDVGNAELSSRESFPALTRL